MAVVIQNPDSTAKQKPVLNITAKNTNNVSKGILNKIKDLNANISVINSQEVLGDPGRLDQKEENNRSNENRSNGKKKTGKQVLSIQDPNAPQTVTSTVTNNQENGAKQARGQVSKSNINTIYVNVGELNGTPLLPIAGAKYMFTDNFGKVFAQFDPSSNNPITFAPNVNKALAVKMLTQAGIDPNNLLTPPKVQANQLTQTKVKPEPVLQVINSLKRKLDGSSNEQNANKRLAIIDNNVNEVKSVLQVKNALQEEKVKKAQQEQNDWRLALMLQAEEANVAPAIFKKSLDANIVKNHFAKQDTQELDIIRNVTNKAQALHAKIYKQESLVEDKKESLVVEDQKNSKENPKENPFVDLREELKNGPQTFDQELERQQQAELKKEARTGTKTFAKSVIDSRQISSPTRTQ
jgi:hypothetical protein